MPKVRLKYSPYLRNERSLYMNKTRIFVSSLLVTAMSFSLLSCSSSKDSSVSESKRDLDSSVREEIHENAENNDLLSGELENKEIKWLSDWDINPDGTGKNVPTELAVFQEKYGGTIKYYPTTYENRFDDLSHYISSGEGIDFFYAGNLDAFPNGAIRGMFAPVDDYIDFSEPLWEDIQELNDSFIWDGKHYLVAVEATGDNVAVVYNRKTIAEAGLEDPKDLYDRGEWNWDTFQDMLQRFSDPDNQHYGLDGWWFEFGLIDTTGVTPVSIEDGKLVNNLSDPAIERVENRLFDLYQTGCIAIGVGDYGWDARPNYIGEGKSLFYPVGLYEFYTEKSQWQSKFGEDVFFVPMPKDPDADEYYIPTGMNSYMFVSGGSNPEGVAKFLECKRFAMLDEATGEIGAQQFRDDFGWTDEMLEMRDEMNRLASENPVIDISRGISKDCGKVLDDNMRNASRGTPWSETYDMINSVVDKFIDEINAAPTSADIE